MRRTLTVLVTAAALMVPAAAASAASGSNASCNNGKGGNGAEYNGGGNKAKVDAWNADNLSDTRCGNPPLVVTPPPFTVADPVDVSGT